MNVRLLITVALILVTSDIVCSQSSVGLSLGGNYSQIRYKTSDGIRNRNLKGLPGVAFEFVFETPVSRFDNSHGGINTGSIHTRIGYKTASFKDIGSNLLTTWTLNFATGTVGYKYDKQTKKVVSPFLAVLFGYDYLLSGVQSRGFEQYDLTKELKRHNVTSSVEAGINYRISDLSRCSLAVSYCRGLINLEPDPNQHAQLHAFRMTALLFFSLAKK